ncbi:phage virion morphogenesis protein [Vibrio neptunius]|uniref:phage virion morphogenesis protein n=1 Tax=Vibrio neptunius TaxID=170651 RepID=UPI001C5CB830|nr:phage virion morphogenesis protein [Vibrio neptunius]QXX09255.1 phage virion morphogenesis protein [Vibrio neptunius]
MSELALKTPDQLTQVVESLVLTASEKVDLNKRMANHASQFFRAQIRAQRDIDNTPYQSRTRRKKVTVRQGVEGAHTANNKNMLLGLARAMRTRVTEETFEVGIKGVAGEIGRAHNQGAQVSYQPRLNGFFDSKVGRWTGGTLTKRHYTMPKRTFIGWTPALERELLAMAAEHFAREEAT